MVYRVRNLSRFAVALKQRLIRRDHSKLVAVTMMLTIVTFAFGELGVTVLIDGAWSPSSKGNQRRKAISSSLTFTAWNFPLATRRLKQCEGLRHPFAQILDPLLVTWVG
jgi:hypothetical protein